MPQRDAAIPSVLDAAARGDPKAAAQLLPLVYRHLHDLAQARMREEGVGNTLQATALVHEAYLRIMGDRESWAGRRHFFSAAALAMRRILVERARQRLGPRRGGGRQRVPLTAAPEIMIDPAALEPDWGALDEALNYLEQEDPSLVQIVHLRYFAGLTVEETARALDRSPRSVDRDWKFARACLLEHLASNQP